jgi:uncharacterized protein (DUF697 family)
VVSAAVAFGTTWALGRSAEVYFFEGKKIKPKELKDEGIEMFKNKFR